MISIAWTHVEQVRNQQQIIASAQMMIDRVADFAKAHAEMGHKLTEAQECYDRCADKLKDSGRSIVQSARQIVKLGVPANPKKPLPEE
jgi:DNA recombination protein RmuC